MNEVPEEFLELCFSEPLLHFGQAEQLFLVRIISSFRDGNCNRIFVHIFTNSASFDKFPTFPGLTAHGGLESKLLHIVCPGYQVVDLRENIFDFLIGEERWVYKVVFSERHIDFGTFSAVGLGLAELTPFAAVVLTFAVVGKIGYRFECVFCPGVKLFL